MDIKQKLIQMYKTTPKCIEFGDFTLHSGVKSNVYVDSKQITLNAHALKLISNCLFDLSYVCDAPFQAIGGMEFGAAPIVCGMLAMSPTPDLRGFVVRKESHGKQGRIAGPLQPNDNVLLVEDVTTTGTTLLECIDIIEAIGCKVVGCLSVVDRGQGGNQAIWKRGIPFMSLLDAKDLGIENAES